MKPPSASLTCTLTPPSTYHSPTLQFIENAKEICSNLKSQGYWADFIDPSSGTAVSSWLVPQYIFLKVERFPSFGFGPLKVLNLIPKFLSGM